MQDDNKREDLKKRNQIKIKELTKIEESHYSLDIILQEQGYQLNKIKKILIL
jgi:hypothetical protein